MEEDCGAQSGVWLAEPSDKGVLESLSERILGRYAASDLADSKTGEVLLERNDEVDEEKAARIVAAGIERVHVRSPLTCQASRHLPASTAAPARERRRAERGCRYCRCAEHASRARSSR
jgi:hypothetical protein